MFEGTPEKLFSQKKNIGFAFVLWLYGFEKTLLTQTEADFQVKDVRTKAEKGVHFG